MLSTVWAKVLKVGAIIAALAMLFYGIKRSGKLEQQLEDNKAASDEQAKRKETETSATLETISTAKAVREVVNASSSSAVDSELRNKWSD